MKPDQNYRYLKINLPNKGINASNNKNWTININLNFLKLALIVCKPNAVYL